MRAWIPGLLIVLCAGCNGTGTGNPSERRSPELFKLGGNIKF